MDPSITSSPTEGDSIKIFLRVRPLDSSISENDFAPRVLDVNKKDNAIILRIKPEPRIFTYDNVADADITQEAVFSIVGKKIIESCVAGYNGTIFAYGQTGSGKTFTMLGPSENADSFQHELRGVIPRSFEYLFSLIAHQQELHGSKRQFLCRCSFLEIYQEQIFDLLDPTSQGLHLRENMNKGVFVDGLIEQVTCSPSDAYQVLIMGWLNRRVAATSMNRESSRSHAVFTVTIESKEEVDGVQNIRTSQLNLVDLAGSERQKDTNTVGTRLKEAGSINKSLSVLGNVIMSLVDLSHGKKRHIPYRDSKLTFLLRDSLGGNTKTHMIACVHPDSKCFSETLSTLNFARSAKLIKNKAVINEDFHGSTQKLQNEIRRLKDMVESLQKTPSFIRHLVPSNENQEADMNSDSVWLKNFLEAMHFREVAENEKKALQDVVNHLHELCNKKDSYIQSAKMIIKFREETISNLKKQQAGRNDEMEKDDVMKSLRGEIKVLHQQLESNPQMAKLAGENRHLRNELKQLKAHNFVENLLSDTEHIARLEKTFRELKLLKESNLTSPRVAKAGSPGKDGLLAAASEQHRLEVKGYQKEIETLKQRVNEVTKVSESQKMEMEVELVSCRKMIKELERVLEAHQLKARIECNVLKDLHCQTLKVMTTPKINSRKDSSASNTPETKQFETDKEKENDNAADALPADLMEGAHDALMEEIRTLTQEYGKLQESIDEKDAEMLRLKQQVGKMELLKQEHESLLKKERAEYDSRKSDYTSAVNTLKEEIDTVKNDLKLLNEENTDLHLVLKSADKQLKEEREKSKMAQDKFKAEKQSLETRLSCQNLDLERTTKDYEEVLKELGALKEHLETSQVTITFYNSRAQELEKLLSHETKLREKLEGDMKRMQSQEDFSILQKSHEELMEQSKANLQQKQTELRTLKTVLEQKDKIIDESKDVLSNLMKKMQTMKSSLAQSEAATASYRMESENYASELEDLKKEMDVKASEVESLKAEVTKITQQLEYDMQKKDFEVSILQEDQENANNTIIGLEQDLATKTVELDNKNTAVMDLSNTVDDLKSKIAEKDQALQDTIEEYENRLKELLMVENGESIRNLMRKKSMELETVRSDYLKLNDVLQHYEETRKEKNKENEVLKADLKEKEFKVKELEAKNEELENLQLNLSSFKLMNNEKVKNLEFYAKTKEDELNKVKDSLDATEALLGHAEQKCGNLEKELFQYRNDENKRETEVNRLKNSLESHYKESMQLSSQIETLNEEKMKVLKDLKTEKETNAKLSGHTNTEQKIRLMEKKDKEYNELAQRYQTLLQEHKKCILNQPASPRDSSSRKIRDITNSK